MKAGPRPRTARRAQYVSRHRHPTARSRPRPRASTRPFVALLAVIVVAQPLGLVMVLSASSVSALARLRLVLVLFNRQRSGRCSASLPSSSRCGSTTTAGGASRRSLLLVAVGSARRRARARRRHQGQRRDALARVRAFALPAVGARQAGAAAVRRRPARPPRRRMVDDWRRRSCRCVVVLAASAVLLMLQPDLGTTIVSRRSSSAMLFVAGTPLLPLGHRDRGARRAPRSCLAMSAPYRRARLLAFLDPSDDRQNTGYQMSSRSSASRRAGSPASASARAGPSGASCPTPTPTSSSPSSARSSGWSACFVVVGLFVAFGVLGVRTALRAPDRFGMLLAAGVTVWVARPGVRQHRRGRRPAADHRRPAAVRVVRRLVARSRRWLPADCCSTSHAAGTTGRSPSRSSAAMTESA